MERVIAALRGVGLRILLIAGGLLAGLALVEGGMRAGGLVYRLYRLPAANSLTSPNGKRTVLCIGDSFTFGVGAKKGRSYPEELSRRLSEAGLEEVRVINAGVPGFNTTEMLQRLRTGVKQHTAATTIPVIPPRRSVSFSRRSAIRGFLSGV